MNHTVYTTVDELQDWGIVARIAGASGNVITIAQVVEWQAHVYDLSQRDPIRRLSPVWRIVDVDPSVNNTNQAQAGTPLVLSDTLRTTGHWKKGGDGFNWLHFISRATTNVKANDGMLAHVPPFIPVGGRTYKVEYRIQTTNEGVIALDMIAQVAPSLSSGMH